MAEIWKPIPGYGGHYEASSMGRIRVLPRVIVKPHSNTGEMREFHYAGRVLNPAKRKGGYLSVTLGIDGKDHTCSVHRLVLMAFGGPCPDGMVCCHNNGDASDNRPENLRWDTPYNNNQDRKKHGNYAAGETHPMAKLTWNMVSNARRRCSTNTELMRELGVSRSQAHRIRTGESWRETSD